MTLIETKNNLEENERFMKLSAKPQLGMNEFVFFFHLESARVSIQVKQFNHCVFLVLVTLDILETWTQSIKQGEILTCCLYLSSQPSKNTRFLNRLSKML